MADAPSLGRGLYALLTDALVPIASIAPAAGVLARAGVPTIQLRLKAATDRERVAVQRQATAEILAAAPRWSGTLCVNDRADLAALLRAEAPPHIGVALHLGQDDLPPVPARRIVGPDVLVGLSTHSVIQVQAAATEPVDYLGFGPVFTTATKDNPDPVVGIAALAAAAQVSRVPIAAIGGLNVDDVPRILQAGAHAACLASALLSGGADLTMLDERARRAVTLAA